MLLSFILIDSVKCQYNSSLAKRLIGYSFIAYQSDANIKFWNCSKCDNYPLLDASSTSNLLYDVSGYAGYSQQMNAIIVGMRGTSDIRAFVLNIDFSQVDWPGCKGCKVQQVFYNSYQSIKGGIINQIKYLLQKHGNLPIILTGHAIGGSLTLLLASDIANITNIKAIYSFGQCRTGNDVFAKYITVTFNNKAYRLVHYADAVVHYPGMNMGYKHHATQIFYAQDMKHFRQCDLSGQDSSCSNSLLVIYYNFNDNALQSYDRLA